MSRGYIHFYDDRNAVPDFAAWERLFEPLGLRLEGFGGRVCAISAEGDQFVVTREWIVEQVAALREVSFQWWYSDSEDVYCRFNPGERHERWSVELGLDGLDDGQVDALIAAVRRHFEEQSSRRAACALVVDRNGNCEERDWRPVIDGREGAPCRPEIFLLS